MIKLIVGFLIGAFLASLGYSYLTWQYWVFMALLVAYDFSDLIKIAQRN